MKQIVFFTLVLSLVGCGQSPVPKALELSAQPTLDPQTSHVSRPLTSSQLVAFHEARIKSDPGGAIGFAMLSEAYLARARETDSNRDAELAEAAARRSLEIRARRNSRAAMRLAQSLLEQHRFSDALKAAEQAVELGGGATSALLLTADILLELGRYAEFKKLLAKLPASDEDPATASVMARWHLVTGENERARSLLEFAAQQVSRKHGIDEATKAWYWTKAGDVCLRVGNPDRAQVHFDRALSVFPQDYRAMAGLAGIAYEKRDWLQAEKWAERALKVTKMTNLMGQLAHTKRHLGKQNEAVDIEKQIDEKNSAAREGFTVAHARSSKSRPSHTHDRLYALVLADQLRDLRLAHHIAEEDLLIRQDIYAYDTFAWTTYLYYKHTPKSVTREGDELLFEAKRAMDKALALGNREPELLAHASAIDARISAIRRIND